MDVNKDCFSKKLLPIPVPLTRGHLQCRDTFAQPDRCPYKTGSTVLAYYILSLSACRLRNGMKYSRVIDLPEVCFRHGWFSAKQNRSLCC